MTKVPKNALIRVDWSDYSENKTEETVNRVKTYFSEKYGVPKTSIKINFTPIIKNSSGKIIDITDGLIDNIMDTAYQRNLYKEWLSLNDVTVDYDRLCKLDDKINEILINQGEEDIRYRRWSIKKLWLDNFISFGNDNEVNYDKIKGLVVVNSVPANQGGKTVFTIDSLLFLFFGKTTKTDVMSEIFNTFTNQDSVVVGGHIEIDGLEYILERKLTRKKNSKGEYKVTTELNYTKIVDGVEIENLEGEQRRETDKLISETIGTYEDFMLTIVATSKNLEDLIETKPTQRGRTLTKFIGLEVIEKKEEINKSLMSEFKSKMKSNLYNTKQLEIDNETYKENIKVNSENIIIQEKLLGENVEKIDDAKEKRDVLLGKKYPIDDEIKRINPDLLKNDIETIKSGGINTKNKLDNIITEIGNLPIINYDEDQHEDYRKKEKKILLEKNSIESKITSTKRLIKGLTEGEICPTCKRPLSEVDHSQEIKENEELLNKYQVELKENQIKLNEVIENLNNQNQEKKNSDNFDRLNMTKDKLELDIERMRVNLKEKTSLLKEYEKNIDFIDENRKLESKILGYKQLIETLEYERDNIKYKIQSFKNDSINKETKIADNLVIIQTIKKEDEVYKIFDVYNRMIGKNGISKLVLSSVIPIINYELDRLLDDVCDFEIELEINDKNEVDFNLIKNGVIKKLKSGSGLELTVSSLALRCVLGRISTLPKPNIIVFDEVLGKVANINLDQVKNLFDKIKSIHETTFLISHNPIVQDWSDKIITVEKIDDISSLLIQ